jgi:plasmid stabilization system protein ParE
MRRDRAREIVEWLRDMFNPTEAKESEREIAALATLLLDQERRIAELEARITSKAAPLEASPSPDGSTLQTMGCTGGEKQAGDE